MGLERTAHAARAGLLIAVDAHRGEGGGEAADDDALDVVFRVETGGHAGQADQQFTGIEIGQIAEGIECGDVGQIGRGPLARNGERITLERAGDLERIELVDGRRQIDLRHRLATGVDVHGYGLRIQTNIGNLELIVARRDIDEREVTDITGNGLLVERGQIHVGSLEEQLGGLVADAAGDRAGRLGAGRGREANQANHQGREEGAEAAECEDTVGFTIHRGSGFLQ